MYIAIFLMFSLDLFREVFFKMFNLMSLLATGGTSLFSFVQMLVKMLHVVSVLSLWNIKY